MKITVNIPKELEKDFSTDRFKEFFERVCADMTGNGCCGRYERETAEMLKDAFQEAEVSSEEAVQDEDRTVGTNCNLTIKCTKDLTASEDSKCANCCIYCDETETCDYRCMDAGRWKTKAAILKKCTYAC